MLQVDKVDNTIANYEFDIEVELLCRFDHSNIIRTLGSGNIPRPFIILEKLKDLSQFLDLNPVDEPVKTIFKKPKQLNFQEVLIIAKDLSDALHYCQVDMHPDAMIIHRDLKPENLGLTMDKRLKLFDFGLCRCVKKRSHTTETYEMTGSTGSLRYMAPEVVLGMPYSEKVDVYSFAMVVWAIAKGKQPFRGFDREMHRVRVVTGGERPKLDKRWPKEFCNLLDVCWHQDFTIRPSFSAISEHLNIMIQSITTTSTESKGMTLFKKMSDAFATTK